MCCILRWKKENQEIFKSKCFRDVGGIKYKKEKFNLQLEERKQRHKIEMEERQLMVKPLKKKI